MTEREITIYELVGGETTFKKLVDVFYQKVEKDPVLRSLFPEDLAPGRQWQFLFLSQFFGGPTRYSEERGHPRLRMRHALFAIDTAISDLWLKHMLDSIDEVGILEPARSVMRQYFEKAAPHMINRFSNADEV